MKLNLFPCLAKLSNSGQLPSNRAMAALTTEESSWITFLIGSNPGRTLEKHLKIALCELLITLSKSGNVSPTWIRNATMEFSACMQDDTDMDRERIRLVFLMFRNKSTENIMRYIHDNLLNLIAPTAIKLSTTITQIKGAGLTGITIIGTAISDYRNYYWGRIAKMLTVEYRAVNAARRAFAGRPFVGFNKATMDKHGLSHYINLAWVCKKLLVEMGTNLTLTTYAGLPDTIPMMDQFIRMIENYKRHSWPGDQEPTDEADAIIANEVHADCWKDPTSVIPLDVEEAINPIGLEDEPGPDDDDDNNDNNDQGGGRGNGSSTDSSDDNDNRRGQGQR